MSKPRVEIFQFEKQVLIGIAAYFLANGINDPKKQQDEKELMTPRVECRYVWGGYTEHFWLRPSVTEKWFDLGSGTLFTKVITRRNDKDQDHHGMLGLVRSLFVDCAEPSAFMTWHRFERMVEGQSTPTIQSGDYSDETTLSFDTRLQILFETKENQIFLT